MPILTTVIGAHPKPDYVPTPDWFRLKASAKGHSNRPTAAYDEFMKNKPSNLEDIHDRATIEIVKEQVEAGIDVPTDGEIRRENYIYYHCRHVNGFDFEHLTEKVMRCGSWTAEVPCIVRKVSAGQPFLVRDYQIAQSATKAPLKITIPGPLTISDSTADLFYNDEKKLGADLADAINQEVMALVAAGCREIQIDEPLFARMPEKAKAFAIENLDRCFRNVPKHVNCSTHICCGYPDRVDNENYAKADRNVYFELAPYLEKTRIDCISLEDAHRHNDLKLLESFPTKKIILGVIAIARTRLEPVDEIKSRLSGALQHIDAERLIAGPDCGLGMLSRDLARQKLNHMCLAAHAL